LFLVVVIFVFVFVPFVCLPFTVIVGVLVGGPFVFVFAAVGFALAALGCRLQSALWPSSLH